MSTIKQKSAFVEIEGGKRIEVRRMRWRSMRDFLRALAKVILSIYPAIPGVDRPGIAAAIFTKLPEVVSGSDELVTILCTASTDLSLDDFAELDALSACEILRASLEINCDDEIKNSLAGIAGAVAGLMPQPAPSRQTPEAKATT